MRMTINVKCEISYGWRALSKVVCNSTPQTVFVKGPVSFLFPGDGRPI